jgi:hypothetical protein
MVVHAFQEGRSVLRPPARFRRYQPGAGHGAVAQFLAAYPQRPEGPLHCLVLELAGLRHPLA